MLLVDETVKCQWAGLSPGANPASDRTPKGICQLQCPCDRQGSPKWLLPLSVSPGWALWLCLSGRLTQAHFRFSPLPWGLEWVTYSVCLLRVSISPSPLALPHSSSKPNFSRPCLPGAKSLVWGAWCGAQIPRSMGRQLRLCFSLCVAHLGLNYTMFPPLLPITMWFLPCICSCRNLFCWSSSLSQQ